jgi:hypothetical protein
MNIQYGLLLTKLITQDQKCEAHDCFRTIKYDDPCFVDINTNMVLCQQCGNCERYSRKKQEEREKAGIIEVPLIKGLDY